MTPGIIRAQTINIGFVCAVAELLLPNAFWYSQLEEWDYQNTQWTNTERGEITGCYGRTTAWARPPHAHQCVEQPPTPKSAATWPSSCPLYAFILSQSLSGLPVNHSTPLPSPVCRREGGRMQEGNVLRLSVWYSEAWPSTDSNCWLKAAFAGSPLFLFYLPQIIIVFA